jgi:hypothetical protein
LCGIEFATASFTVLIWLEACGCVQADTVGCS